MTFDGTMIYNPAGLADLSSVMASFSQEFEQIAQEAHNLLSASADYFQGPHGATQYAQVQLLVNEGIEDGRAVFHQQGGVVQEVGQNMAGTDTNVGNQFMSC